MAGYRLALGRRKAACVSRKHSGGAGPRGGRRGPMRVVSSCPDGGTLPLQALLSR